MSDMKWYVLRTAGSKEKKAKEHLEKEIERNNLQDQVAQVVVPVKKEIVTKNGKRKAVDKLLFPGYVLIQAELNPRLEYIIRNLVPGMSGFLTEKRTTIIKKDDNHISRVNPDGSVSRLTKKDAKEDEKAEKTTEITERIPIPIRDEEAAAILGNQDENVENAAEVVVDYNLGESVRITDGPFSGFNGTVDEILEDRSKIKVIVEIFGRKTQVELNFTQVTKE